MTEHYKLILQRIDGYINSVNTKGGFIVAFTTFLCGSILAKYSELKPLFDKSCCPGLIDYLLVALFVISIATVFIVGMAIFPYLKSGNSSKSKYHSNIFFNSIAEFESDEEYVKSCNNYDEAAQVDDLQRQIHTLSKGLKSKFQKIGIAMYLFFLNLVILGVIMSIIIL